MYKFNSDWNIFIHFLAKLLYTVLLKYNIQIKCVIRLQILSLYIVYI